jgi:hypothetical protein
VLISAEAAFVEPSEILLQAEKITLVFEAIGDGKIRCSAGAWEDVRCANTDITRAGALMSYGPNFPALFRRAAEIVDKILSAKPGDIQVEQPTELISSSTSRPHSASLFRITCSFWPMR